ncbi:hypothetical protein [Chromobacterium vaccinii]|uniref:hypothetical protein n=1 Tax=Chromobacterium vaccinii TaxID=1108595 RepID=UPI0011C066E5|nr:hypothetical protein [Chromobacterium vaccinii]
MAAISSSLASLIKILGTEKILFPRRGYFESLILIKDFFALDVELYDDGYEYSTRSIPNNRNSILYIDSYYGFNNSNDIAGIASNVHIRAIFIDSTCYAIDSDELKALLTSLIRFSIPIIIARSHHKLDTLGTEFVRLGSISVLTSNVFDSELIKKS